MNKIKIVFYLILIFVLYKGYDVFRNFEFGVGDRVAKIEEISEFDKTNLDEEFIDFITL